MNLYGLLYIMKGQVLSEISEIFEINCTMALVGFPDIPLDIYEPSTPPDFITPAISMWIQSPGGANSCKKYDR